MRRFCLSYGGNEQIGSFKLDFYDSSGNVQVFCFCVHRDACS